jgi:hypothetical protein
MFIFLYMMQPPFEACHYVQISVQQAKLSLNPVLDSLGIIGVAK